MSLTTEQMQKAAEARREYHRRWRARNKDKVKQYNTSYWLRLAEAQKQEGANEQQSS